MSAIAYFLEDEGIATTGISLVRENTESLAPPRFLWVPFPLGRPLGVPGDAPFQHRVIRAALALLDRSHGPVLEDYVEEAPAQAGAEPFVCPVNFATAVESDGSLLARLLEEVQSLRPWYELAAKRRGRSTVGLRDADLSQLAKELAEAAEPSEDDPLASPNFEAVLLKYAVEDLKAFYQEAAAGQPGDKPWAQVADWLWHETALGEAMLSLHARVVGRDDKVARSLAACVAPRRAVERARRDRETTSPT